MSFCMIRCRQHLKNLNKSIAKAHQSTAALPQSVTRSWTLVEKSSVPEFDLEAILLEHKETRAQYLHLQTNDSNNAFSVNFRTTPMDSTGVAHILEHTTLCGSNKYPVRDPFMKMLNKSLSTFMNAMTGPDYTLYPFSTCNPQDFKNLMSVYLDSVFCPLLREQDFLQEGWRLENEEIEDKQSPFVIKGVVFNEMKGAYSDSQQLFGQHLLNNLLPSHTYSYSSGGYPLHIPSLSWEQLKDFHSSHYHPSNARIFTYGDIPLETNLETINEYLEKFQKLEMDTSVPKESRWSAPVRKAVSCAPDAMNPDPTKQSTVAVSYLLSDITDINESFTLQVLGELLMGGPSSPFYKTLVQPGIGAGFSPVSGYDSHIKETTFTVGLQNIDAKDVDMVIETIDSTIDQVVEEGFPQERIDAVLHSYELGLKHRSGNFGMNLIMSMTAFWNHSHDPVEYLRINKTLDWFKKQIADDPKFLQEKVKQYFKDNQHKLIQTMDPDEGFTDKEQVQFDQLEQKLRTNLTEQDKEVIRQKSLDLLASQDMKDDDSCLPTLRVADISEEYSGTPLEHLTLCGVPTQVSVQPTNQVSYFRAMIDTSGVPEDLKPYLPIFSSFLSKLGAKHLGYEELDTKIELSTGGLSAGCNVNESPDDLYKISEYLLLSSHCLDRNIERMFELWNLIFEDLHLKDSNRVSTLVKMSATGASNGIAHSGHRYAMACAAGAINPASALSEMYSGMQHVNLLSKLSMQDGVVLMTKLKTLASLLLNKNCIKVALNTVPESRDQLVKGTESFLSHLSGTCPASMSGIPSNKNTIFQTENRKMHHVVPFPINFTAQSVPTVPYTHEDAAPLRVLASVLSSKFLHTEIREKGGAYGGGALAGSGTLTYYSYRDPKNIETFTVYRRAGEWAAERNFTEKDVEEGQLRVFQKLDEPVTPGHRGLRDFLSGIDDQMFREHRIRIKSVVGDDLVRVADKYLIDPSVLGRTLIGPAQTGLDDLGWNVQKQ